MLYESESGDMHMAFTGECMITRGLSMFREDRYLKMVEILRNADLSFTHAEILFHNYEDHPNPHQIGTYVRSDPSNIKELQWLGIDIVSCAHNHAFDFGENGVLANIRYLDEAGMPHAGSGRNLAEARAPAYTDTPKGRVALISVTDSGPAESRAGEQRRDMKGRPGANWLRHTAEYTVDREALDALRRVSEELGWEECKRSLASAGRGTVDTDTEFHLLGQPMYSPVPTLKFVLGETFRRRLVPNPDDLEGILQRVSDARRMADWVLVTMHNHEPGETEDDPGDHAVALAKGAIDAGADVFIGHGPHRDRGIEIYKGKPIFYSLGDFILQNDTVLLAPHDNMLRYGLGWEATPADYYDARSANDTRWLPANPVHWQSAIATATYEGRALKEVRLHPIDLGFKRPRGQRGRPVLADSEVARSVLERFQRLSKGYGTDVKIKDGVGAIKVG